MKLHGIFIIMVVMFIASACTKDALMTKDKAPELKKADLKFNIEFTLYLDTKVVFNFPKMDPMELPVAGRMDAIVPHLGKVQVGTETDYLDGSYWKDPTPTPALDDKGYPCLNYGNTTGHFIAANGDELTAKVSGVIYPITAYPKGRPGDGLSFVGNVNYTGGTGRFANADGEGTVTGVFLTASIMLMKSEGTLLNVGQSKK